jgi:moderate conductance mechanosensitive channel
MNVLTVLANIDITPSALFDPLIQGINNTLPKIPEVIVSLLLGYILIRLLLKLSRYSLRFTRLPAGLKNVLLSMWHALLWIFLAISMLQLLGLGHLALAASVSVAVLSVAFATGVSSVIADILAGVFLAKDPDFKLGDKVKLGDPVTEGIVEAMDMRRVRIRDKSNKLHVIPNSVVERKEWVVIARKNEM